MSIGPALKAVPRQVRLSPNTSRTLLPAVSRQTLQTWRKLPAFQCALAAGQAEARDVPRVRFQAAASLVVADNALWMKVKYARVKEQAAR
jgi:hypothetical protein